MKYVRKYGDPSASHNCFAYKIGQVFRSTDDGEPGGRATVFEYTFVRYQISIRKISYLKTSDEC